MDPFLMGRVDRPSVAVIAFPYLYTSVIADAVRRHGRYRVDAPDVLAGDWDIATPYDVVIASLPVPAEWGRSIIRLPEDFADPLSVSIGDLTVEIEVDEVRPLHGLLAVIDVVAVEDAASLVSMGRTGGQPPG